MFRDKGEIANGLRFSNRVENARLDHALTKCTTMHDVSRPSNLVLSVSGMRIHDVDQQQVKRDVSIVQGL